MIGNCKLHLFRLENFFHQSKQVPCWMFIMWISQMMALLDKPEGSTVHHILDELTENYPQVFIMQFFHTLVLKIQVLSALKFFSQFDQILLYTKLQ